jgi:hypothetical protein
MSQQELKAALLERAFDRALVLIEEWGARVRAEMKAAGSRSERQRILDGALAFGQQNLYLAQVVRAQVATELRANSASFLYNDAALEQPRWRLSG